MGIICDIFMYSCTFTSCLLFIICIFLCYVFCSILVSTHSYFRSFILTYITVVMASDASILKVIYNIEKESLGFDNRLSASCG